VAFAEAVNLRAADVPLLRPAISKRRAETSGGPFGDAIDSCESAPVRAGESFGISSQRYVHLSPPLQSVGSGVYWFKSEALAREYLDAAYTRRFASCVKTAAAEEQGGEGVQAAPPMFHDPRLSRIPISLPGARAYGLRLAAGASLGGPGAHEAYTDFLSFVQGDALITLTAIGQGRPFPAAQQRRLLSTIHLRAQAHAG
jgi:hypothetical protein